MHQRVSRYLNRLLARVRVAEAAFSLSQAVRTVPRVPLSNADEHRVAVTRRVFVLQVEIVHVRRELVQPLSTTLLTKCNSFVSRGGVSSCEPYAGEKSTNVQLNPFVILVADPAIAGSSPSITITLGLRGVVSVVVASPG